MGQMRTVEGISRWNDLIGGPLPAIVIASEVSRKTEPLQQDTPPNLYAGSQKLHFFVDYTIQHHSVPRLRTRKSLALL